jgi:hypothetical protein
MSDTPATLNLVSYDSDGSVIDYNGGSDDYYRAALQEQEYRLKGGNQGIWWGIEVPPFSADIRVFAWFYAGQNVPKQRDWNMQQLLILFKGQGMPRWILESEELDNPDGKVLENRMKLVDSLLEDSIEVGFAMTVMSSLKPSKIPC